MRIAIVRLAHGLLAWFAVQIGGEMIRDDDKIEKTNEQDLQS